MGRMIIAFSLILFLGNCVFESVWLGFVGILLFFIGIIYRTRSWKSGCKDWVLRSFLLILCAFSIFVISLDGVYLVYKLTPVLVWLIFLAIAMFFIFYPAKCHDSIPKVRFPKIFINEWMMWFLLCALADIAIIFLFFQVRNDGAIVSPWTGLGIWPFVLFALGTACLMRGMLLKHDNISLLFSIFHTFTALCVSMIVYAVGFGFDPFLHRAAQEELAIHGFIEPKQILYSGQYVFVVAVHYITHIPIKIIDIWSVPVFSSFLIPIATYFGLRDGWGLQKRLAMFWWPICLILPFMLMTFTVPFTWTYAWFVAIIFLLPASIKSSLASIALMITSLAMILFHPLLAVPTCVFVFGFIAWTRLNNIIWRSLVIFITFVLLCASVPAMFYVYQVLSGQEMLISQIGENLNAFYYLFLNPFTDPYPFIPLYLQIIYAIRYWSPMIIFAVGICLMALKAQKMKFIYMYLVLGIGLLVSLFGLSTMFVFKNIISHEQSEFALRILTVLYLMPIPVFVVWFATLSKRLWARVLLVVLVITMIIHAWYFSYPQYNLKYPYISPSVSGADVEAVHAMDELAGEKQYLVLSNQMTSAAAIQEFHFAKYITLDNEQVLWYAIPTGGKLYEYYSRAIYEGPYRAIFDELHEKTGVGIIYFVLQDYWKWYDGFVQELENGADSQFTVHGGDITIYQFNY